MKVYGIIGNPLTKSISKQYFTVKFKNENITNCTYELFPLKNINDFRRLIALNPEIAGLNVTTPYKLSIIPFLDFIDVSAYTVGAVNTIKVIYKNKERFLKGFNTDILGFGETITPMLKNWHNKAIIIGTGGAALAASYVLRDKGIIVKFLTRDPKNLNQIGYYELNKRIVDAHKIIINATPVGMYVDESKFLDLPYQFISKDHLVYDMVYSEQDTLFIQKAKESGAVTKNGLDMFYIQAEKSWEIWNTK